MHNIKDLRKNLETFKKKLTDRNIDFNAEDFSKKDTFNRELISKKKSLEQEKKTLSKSKDKANFEKSKKISDQIETISKKQIDISSSPLRYLRYGLLTYISDIVNDYRSNNYYIIYSNNDIFLKNPIIIKKQDIYDLVDKISDLNLNNNNIFIYNVH